MDQLSVDTTRNETRPKAASFVLSPKFLFLGPICALGFANLLFAGRFIARNGFADFALIEEVYYANIIVLPFLLGVVGLAALRAWKDRRPDRRLFFAAVFNIALATFMFGARVYCTHLEPRWLAVRQSRIMLPEYPASRPLRILHISDTQSPAVGAYEERVFRKIAELKPDPIFHTGGFSSAA